MSDYFKFPEVIKEWTRSTLVAKSSGLIAKIDRISPSFFLDRVPQRIATKFPRWERERELFIYIRFQTLRQADLWEKIYIHIYLYIVCDFFRIVCERREKSYRVCRFRSLLSLISHLHLSFLSFLYPFLSRISVSFLFRQNFNYVLAINASSRSFSLSGSVLALNCLKDSGNERKDQNATRIENAK